MMCSVWESLHITWQVGDGGGEWTLKKTVPLWITVETDGDHVRSIIMNNTELF